MDTLLRTNISPIKTLLKMIFLFPRWDILVPWRVYYLNDPTIKVPITSLAKLPSPPWQSSHHLPGKHLLNLQKVSTPYFINKFRYLKSRYENLCKLYGYGLYKGKPQTPQKQPYKVQYLHFLLPETIGLDPFYPFVHILNSTVFLLLDLSGKKQQKQN